MSDETSTPRYNNAGREGREGRPRAASPVAERPSPHDLEVERAVLSAMLRDPSYCGSKAVELLGAPGAFYSQVHREIFAAYMRFYTLVNSVFFRNKYFRIVTAAKVLFFDRSYC